jgi:RNA polymerase sigma-70 factor, ECF subfamily
LPEKYDLTCTDISISEYVDALYRYAMVLTRNRTEAEDLVQETYVRALNAQNRLKSDSSVKSWLMVILRNIWLNELRVKGRAQKMREIDDGQLVSNGIPEFGKDACSICLRRQEIELVQQAIQELSVDLREIILMREFEEMSYYEIAKVLNCPLGTVMSRLSRARYRLRELLSSAL